jgi:hypothetical protein
MVLIYFIYFIYFILFKLCSTIAIGGTWHDVLVCIVCILISLWLHMGCDGANALHALCNSMYHNDRLPCLWKFEERLNKSIKSREQTFVKFAYYNSNRKNFRQSTHINTELLHILKICLSFRSCYFQLHLCYVTYYFVVFIWKNIQNEQLYTLTTVHISCCTYSVTNGASSLPVACNEKFHQITQSADGNYRATTIFKGKEAISNCWNFRIWCTMCITFRTSHSRQLF